MPTTDQDRQDGIRLWAHALGACDHDSAEDCMAEALASAREAERERCVALLRNLAQGISRAGHYADALTFNVAADVLTRQEA